MKPAPAPSLCCHPEGGCRVGTRGTRNLGLALLLVPLLLLAPACEDLPEAPNIPPTASFIFNPVSPITAGETPVSFNATGSRDSDGSVTSYTWNFGDGVEQTVSEPTVTHVFVNTPASCIEIVYTVLLTVTDDTGDRGSASQPVRVIEAPPPSSAQCAGR